MKQIRILWIVCLLSVSIPLHAQISELIDNVWGLSELNIDGQQFFPPTDSNFIPVTLEFVTQNTGEIEFVSGVCDFLAAQLQFEDPPGELPIFSAPGGFASSLEGCDDSNDGAFQDVYFDFYETSENNTFEYNIVFLDDIAILEVMSSNGDIAFYVNPFLGTEDLEIIQFKVYPNPVEAQLTIEMSQPTEIYTWSIMDLQGRTINTLEGNTLRTNNISVDHLSSGLFFIRIANANGQEFVQRFLKK